MSNGRYSASVDQLSQHLLRSAARRRDQPSTRSPALRYWNLAQQRHYRRSAPCRRAMPVSGDCAPCHGPHTRGKRPGFRPRQANSRERRTVCWREKDSNHRSLSRVEGRKGLTSRHASQGRPSSRLHLAARAAKWRSAPTSGPTRGREWCRSFVTASSRAPAASTAAPLNRTRIAPVPVSRDCRNSPEHGVPCHHGEGVK